LIVGLIGDVGNLVKFYLFECRILGENRIRDRLPTYGELIILVHDLLLGIAVDGSIFLFVWKRIV
jgi:hypothetical protein